MNRAPGALNILRATWSLGSVMVGGGVDLAPALTSGLVTVDDGAGGMTGIVIDGPDAIAVAVAVTAIPSLIDALEKIVRATSVPQHKLTDTAFLRASASIALSFAEAALAKAGAAS